MNELRCMLVQEEMRLKNKGTHFVHLIRNQAVGKKAIRKQGNGKHGSIKVNGSFI